ncbi:MAG: hypothetical protein LUH47_04965 [Clostridiales bacterium]|nr:hypothetical protein [Clostridiales bacterium]
MKKITTREDLEMEIYGCLDSAVIDYGNYIIATWVHCFNGIVTEIYKMIETPEETGLGRCECKISLTARKEGGFEDNGHALEWALNKIK